MNKLRRKALEKLNEVIAEAKERLEEIYNEENDYLENIPENLQGSERYEKAESATYAIGEAIEALDSTIDYIEEAME